MRAKTLFATFVVSVMLIGCGMDKPVLEDAKRAVKDVATAQKQVVQLEKEYNKLLNSSKIPGLKKIAKREGVAKNLVKGQSVLEDAKLCSGQLQKLIKDKMMKSYNT